MKQPPANKDRPQPNRWSDVRRRALAFAQAHPFVGHTVVFVPDCRLTADDERLKWPDRLSPSILNRMGTLSIERVLSYEFRETLFGGPRTHQWLWLAHDHTSLAHNDLGATSEWDEIWKDMWDLVQDHLADLLPTATSVDPLKAPRLAGDTPSLAAMIPHWIGWSVPVDGLRVDVSWAVTRDPNDADALLLNDQLAPVSPPFPRGYPTMLGLPDNTPFRDAGWWCSTVRRAGAGAVTAIDWLDDRRRQAAQQRLDKPDGWTKKDLVRQVHEGLGKFSASTFDRIRAHAQIPAAEASGKGTDRRYGKKEVCALMKSAASGPFRDGADIASCWGELVGG